MVNSIGRPYFIDFGLSKDDMNPYKIFTNLSKTRLCVPHLAQENSVPPHTVKKVGIGRLKSYKIKELFILWKNDVPGLVLLLFSLLL